MTSRRLHLLIVLLLFTSAPQLHAQSDTAQTAAAIETAQEHPDTCRVGLFVMTLFDLDYPNNQFSTEFWMWTLSPADSLNPLTTIEITNSKANTFESVTSQVRNGVRFVYVAFAICLMVFFFEQEEIESRFSLLVGALFAAVANKYIVDSYLPLSSNFALVDKVHVITFLYILICIGVSVYSMHHERKRRQSEGDDNIAGTRLDRIAFWTLLISYAGINGYYLIRAI